MLEQLKKKSITKALPMVIILLACGIGLIGIELSNLKALFRGHVAFETLLPEEINGDLIVDAAIDLNFGCYMEEYEENTSTHIKRTTSLYYVILTGDENSEDCRYMGIKVPVTDEKAMEDMAEATYYYEYSEPIHYSGAINKMPSEDYKYFRDYFLEAGWSDEDIQEYALPYYIHVGALTGGAAVSVYVMAGIGAVLILISLILFIKAVSGGNLKAFKKELVEAGFNETNFDFEYEGAVLLNKKNDTRIGRRLTFFMLGSKPRVIANDKIVWAYQATTTHRTNGIKTGTTYEVAISKFDKKLLRIPVANEQTAQDILQHIDRSMPWVVVGYNDELNRMHNQDYQGFLNLRYNQTEHDVGYQTGNDTGYQTGNGTEYQTGQSDGEMK